MTERISVSALDARSRRLARPVSALLACFLRIAGKPAASVDVFLVDDAQVPQNVLSYLAARGEPRPDKGPGFLGELYLNPSRIRREGGDLAQLCAHGVLHLLGLAHKSRSDYRVMERAERALRRTCSAIL